MKIRRALISVYDKTGVVEFARALHDEFGIEIISTGGTAKALGEAGIPVTLVETITGCPELLGGRVKTLHPKIHAAILADRDNPEHMRQLAEQGIEPIDLVVVNLYPFEKAVADPACTFEQALEMIDIGGVALLRAAAKNHRHVLAPVYLDDRTRLVLWLREGTLTRKGWLDVARDYANAALLETSRYDAQITEWLSRGRFFAVSLARADDLRYGENPHQAARVAQPAERPPLGWRGGSIDRPLGLPWASFLLGNDHALSYNNYLDADAALGLCAELTRAARRSAKLCFAPRPGDPRTAGDVEKRTGGDSQKQSGALRDARRRGIFAPVRDEHWSRRNLPHWQLGSATYWVSFASRIGDLTPEERDIAMNALRHWDGQRMDLHAAVVMPDHVHALLTPRPLDERRQSFENLSDLLRSIKSFSGREISKRRGQCGQAWVHESYDHWVRSDKEFEQKWRYLVENVVKEGLAQTPGEYPWLYVVDYFALGIGTPVSSDTPVPPILGGRSPLSRRQQEPPGGPRVNGDKAEPCPAGSKAEPCPTGSRAEPCPTGSKAEPCTTAGETTDTDRSLPGCVFVKHTNACGVGLADARGEVDVADARGGGGPGAVEADGLRAARVTAYQRAYLGDPNAAMGGVLAVNFVVDSEFAAVVMDTYQRFGKPLRDARHPAPPGGFFVEVWIAPRFTDDAVAVIRGTYEPSQARPAEELGERRLPQVPPRKDWGQRVRLLAVGEMGVEPDANEVQYRSIAGGMLVQSPDLVGLNEAQWQVVTKRAPGERELADLRLAWLICKHTKSNAITICKDGMLIGNGAGQMSRVMSCRVAVWLAQENGHLMERGTRGPRDHGTMGSGPDGGGPVAASDAFFPFADGPRVLIEAGVTALIQPGGGKRDQVTIDLCDSHGVAMIFTGARHFRH